MSRTLDRALGEFEKMPTITGDPAVESGSNSDGEWTRWGDGTQQGITKAIMPETPISTSTNAQNPWPMPFVSAPNSVHWSVREANIGAGSINAAGQTYRNGVATNFTTDVKAQASLYTYQEAITADSYIDLTGHGYCK